LALKGSGLLQQGFDEGLFYAQTIRNGIRTPPTKALMNQIWATDYSINSLRTVANQFDWWVLVCPQRPVKCSAGRRTDSSKRRTMTSITAKVISAAVCLVVLIATPALAATVHKAKPSHHYAASGAGAYASQIQRPNEIYSWDGRDLGTDPDPNIRFQLMRDQNWGGN